MTFPGFSLFLCVSVKMWVSESNQKRLQTLLINATATIQDSFSISPLIQCF